MTKYADLSVNLRDLIKDIRQASQGYCSGNIHTIIICQCRCLNESSLHIAKFRTCNT